METFWETVKKRRQAALPYHWISTCIERNGKKRKRNGEKTVETEKKHWRTKRQRNRQETEKKHYGNGKETFQKKRNRNAQNVSSNTKDMYDPFNKMSPVPVGCALRRGRLTCIHIYIYVYNGRTAVLPSYHAIKFNPMLYHTI
jgi:hypothetical protein